MSENLVSGMSTSKTKYRVHRERHVILFHSQKNDCSIRLESFSELKHACLLENDPAVLSFASQPESIEIAAPGKSERFTPDFLIKYIDGKEEYLEVHHAHYFDQDYQDKIERFDKYTRATIGVPIRLIVEETLNEIELVNLQLIAESKSKSISDNILNVRLPTQVYFDELIHFLKHFEPADAIGQAYYLLSIKLYHFDNNDILSVDTLLSLDTELY